MISRDVAAASFAVALGALASFVVIAIAPAIYYLPLENTVVLGGKPQALVVMDYYGRVAIVLAAAGVGALLGWFLGSKLSPMVLKLCIAWAAAGSLLAMCLWESQLSNRTLSRLALPPSLTHHDP